MVLDAGVVPPQIPQGATQEQAQAIAMQAQQNPQQIATIEDFNPKGLDIMPESDPNFVSDGQKMMKAQSLLQDVQMGLPLNVQVVTEQVLRAQGQDNIQALMTLPPQGPNMQQLEYQLEVERTKIDAFKAWSLANLQLAQADAAEQGSNLDHLRAVVDDYAKVFGIENDQAMTEIARQTAQQKATTSGSNSK